MNTLAPDGHSRGRGTGVVEGGTKGVGEAEYVFINGEFKTALNSCMKLFGFKLND